MHRITVSFKSSAAIWENDYWRIYQVFKLMWKVDVTSQQYIYIYIIIRNLTYPHSSKKTSAFNTQWNVYLSKNIACTQYCFQDNHDDDGRLYHHAAAPIGLHVRLLVLRFSSLVLLSGMEIKLSFMYTELTCQVQV